MKFLIDKEIDLNKQDFLNTSTYSKALKEVISCAPSDTSFTIGLFGEWGSGKSSIVKTVEEEFRKINKDKIKFVIYDAWKYSNDSFRRMFLLKLQEELKFERTSKFDSFYRNKMSDVSVKRKVDWKYIVATIAIFFIGVFLIYLIPSYQNEAKITLALVITFIGILVNVLGRAFSDYKVTVQEPMIFAPEQFEECFNEMIPKVFESTNSITQFSKWIKGQNYISGLDQLVIVIDNIDRCPKDKAYEMITNIKSFLSTQKKVIFLIPVDDEALKRHIIKEENNETKEAEEFLRKFFSVTIRIKPFKRFDLYDFTNNINKNLNLNFNPTTIDIVSKEYATNPRRIIQFINDFMSELKIFELSLGKEFIINYESLICKMLILRQEWPDYYRKISKNSSLVNDPDGLQNFLYEHQDLNSFLNLTDSITNNESYSIIETVLSTFDRESKLSSEIIAIIDKKEIDSLEIIIKDNRVDKSTLVDYLIERINTGIKRKTFKTDVNNLFELICHLNLKLGLDKEQNSRVATEVKTRLIDFFKFISNLEALVSYAHILNRQSLNYLNEFIKSLLLSGLSDKSNENVDAFTRNLFNAYIKNDNSRNELINLSDLFEIEYNRNTSRLDEYELDSDQLNDIVNENVLSTVIKRIDSINLENESYQELVYASANIDFSNVSFKEAVSKLHELIPDFTNFSKEQVVKLIADVNKFLLPQKNKVKNEDEKEVLLAFKNKLTSNWIKSGISINVLTESPTKEELSIITAFLKYIYIISNGAVDILTNLNAIISASPIDGQTAINKRLIEIINENKHFHLTQVNSIILNDETYSKDSLELTKFILLKKADKDTYKLNDDLCMLKLEKIIINFTSTYSELITSFLEEICEDNRAKGLLTSIVVKLNKNDILLLPKKLQELFFEKVSDGDNIFEYKENIDFLKVVASKGEMKHISKVVKVIVNKLTRQDTIDDGIDILREVRELKSSDKKTIEGVVESIEDSSYKEEAMTILKNF